MSEYIDFNEILVNEDVLSQVDLSEIIDWCQKGEYKKCMELSASKLTEGYFDIRLVCYYLFGLCCKNFNEHAIYAFDSLHFILLERYQALQPHKFKSRQIESALAWFINGVLDNLSYQESHKSRLGIAEDVVNAFNLLVECMMQLAPNLQDAYKKLQHFLQQRLAKTDQGESCQHEDEHKDSCSPTMAEDRKALGRQVDAIALKEASPKWFDLLAKLETFNLLKAQGDTIATAAMYHHLYKELSQFNPLQYFPSIFIGFYQQSFDPKFQTLVNHMNDNLNSLQWSILENIIHSDHRLLLDQTLDNNGSAVDKEVFNGLIANTSMPSSQSLVHERYDYERDHSSQQPFQERENHYNNEFIRQD
ncbi:type VI secretion system protein IglI family protein [Cysteiniphilum sp. 6C5]|uniref:type VI secretion system protein IglI family protein n=1 Tax=unclassified Cysteiniphilum TaxID=2610889 RepID=UPI003F851636